MAPISIERLFNHSLIGIIRQFGYDLCPGIVREKRPALKIGFSGVLCGLQPAKWKLGHQTTLRPSSGRDLW
jgi:hypothetical protein